MSAKANKATVRRVLSAYGEGNIAPLRDLLDPEVIYHSNSPKELFRFGGRHQGLAAGIVALSALASDYTIHHIAVHDLVAEGDVVWVTMDMDRTDRRNKLRLVVRVAARWEFRNGRIVSVEEYWDTADVALKQALVKTTPSGK